MGGKKKKMVNLALQGGGTHGAFAWGILDRLLEDGRIDIEGLSATSAGSLNAVAYAWGAMKGGPDGARQALNDLWREVSKAGELYSPVRQLPLERMAGRRPRASRSGCSMPGRGSFLPISSIRWISTR